MLFRRNDRWFLSSGQHDIMRRLRQLQGNNFYDAKYNDGTAL